MLDPSTDFTAIADGLAPVTLTRPGSPLSVEIPGALWRRVLRRETASSDGRYTMADVVWHLPVASLSETPQVGDVLVDADDRQWTILGVRPATLHTRWHCVCRNLVAAHGLNTTVDIDKAVLAETEPGIELVVWQPWRIGLLARIQPVETLLRTEGEQAVAVATCHVYLLEEIEIDTTCRVRATDGTTYNILGSYRSQRVDELMYLEVQKNP